MEADETENTQQREAYMSAGLGLDQQPQDQRLRQRNTVQNAPDLTTQDKSPAPINSDGPNVHVPGQETQQVQSKIQKILDRIIPPQVRTVGQTVYDHTHPALEYAAESGTQYCKQWTDKASIFVCKKWEASPLSKKELPAVCKKASVWAHKVSPTIRNMAGSVATSFASLPFNPFGGWYWQGAATPLLAIPGKFLFDFTRPTETRDQEKVKANNVVIRQHLGSWAGFHFLSGLEGRNKRVVQTAIANFLNDFDKIVKNAQQTQPVTTLSKIQNAASSTLKASLYWGALYAVPFRVLPMVPLLGIVPNLLTPSNALLRVAMTSSLLFAFTLGEKHSKQGQKKYYLTEDVTAQITMAAKKHFASSSKLDAFEKFLSEVDEFSVIDKSANPAPAPLKKENKREEANPKPKPAAVNLASQPQETTEAVNVEVEESDEELEVEDAARVRQQQPKQKERLEGKGVKPQVSEERAAAAPPRKKREQRPDEARPNVVQSLSLTSSEDSSRRREPRAPRPTRQAEAVQAAPAPSVYDYTNDRREARLTKVVDSDDYTLTSVTPLDVLLSKIGRLRHSMKRATPEEQEKISAEINATLDEGMELISKLVLKSDPSKAGGELSLAPVSLTRQNSEGHEPRTSDQDATNVLKASAEQRKKRENKGAGGQ